MEEVRAFREVSGHDFRAAEKWDRPPRYTSMWTERVSGLLFDVTRRAPCLPREEADSVSIACIPTANSNPTTRSISSMPKATSLKVLAHRCSYGLTECTSIRTGMSG